MTIPDPNIHPLQNQWVLWADNPSMKQNLHNWLDSLTKISTISTIEDFWMVHNNITGASKLSNGMNLHFFKDGITPQWEDKANAKGGKWVLFFKRESRLNIDQLWLLTMLMCVGGISVYSNDISGCVVSIRKQGNRISLWTQSADDEKVQLSIGNLWKDVLKLDSNIEISYISHSDSSSRQFKKETDKYKL